MRSKFLEWVWSLLHFAIQRMGHQLNNLGFLSSLVWDWLSIWMHIYWRHGLCQPCPKRIRVYIQMGLKSIFLKNGACPKLIHVQCSEILLSLIHDLTPPISFIATLTKTLIEIHFSGSNFQVSFSKVPMGRLQIPILLQYFIVNLSNFFISWWLAKNTLVREQFMEKGIGWRGP